MWPPVGSRLIDISPVPPTAAPRGSISRKYAVASSNSGDRFCSVFIFASPEVDR
jgi:hypothetical protein